MFHCKAQRAGDGPQTEPADHITVPEENGRPDVLAVTGSGFYITSSGSNGGFLVKAKVVGEFTIIDLP